MADKPISGLPALPGNLTLGSLLAVVQGGITYKAEAEDIINSGIIATTSNGRISIKLPAAGIHIQYHPSVTVVRDNNDTLLSNTSTYPSNAWIEPFANPTRCFVILPSTSNSYTGAISATTGSVRVTTDARTDFPRVVLYREDGPNWTTGTEVTDIAAFAVGRYNP